MRKKKTVVASLLALTLCGCLMTGGTYALFTSEEQTNIAVQAGSVKLTATIDQNSLTLRSPTAVDANGKVVDATNAATKTAFANGGTATFDENDDLLLANMTPGDSATFHIVLRNESNVDIQYQTTVAVEEDDGLFAGLQIAFDDVAFTDASESEWISVAKNDTLDRIVKVEVTLPATAPDDYQDTGARLGFGVTAVQGNATVGTSVKNETELAKAIEAGASDIVLTENVEISCAHTILEGSELNVHGKNKTLSYKEGYTGKMFSVSAGASLALHDVEIDAGATNFQVSIEGTQVNGVYDGYPAVNKSTLAKDTFATEPLIESSGNLIANDLQITNFASDAYNVNAVRVLYGTAEFNGCNFSHNYNPNRAAAVNVGGPALEGATKHSVDKVVFNGCTFADNFVNAGYGGGALCIVNTTEAEILNCKFVNNCAMGYNCGGGAIFFGRDGAGTINANAALDFVQARIDNCEFSGNHSGNDGFAIHNECAEIKVTNCDFDRNYGHSGSSSVGTISNMSYVNDSKGRYDCVIKGCDFTNNVGAAYIFGDHATLVDLTMEDCTSSGNVGSMGILLYAASGSIKNCSFQEDKASVTVIDVRSYALPSNAYYAPQTVDIENVTVADCEEVPGVLIRKYRGEGERLTPTVTLYGVNAAWVKVEDASVLCVVGSLIGDVTRAADTPVDNIVIKGEHIGRVIDEE